MQTKPRYKENEKNAKPKIGGNIKEGLMFFVVVANQNKPY